MSADVVSAVAKPPKERKATNQFDTALGWSPRAGVSMLLRVVLCAITVCVFAVPFLLVISSAFSTNTNSTELHLLPSDPTLLSFQKAIDRGVLGYFANSLVIVGGGLLLQIVISIFSAYALSRFRFRGRALVMGLFLLTMMLPEEIIAVPLAKVIADLPLLGVSLKGSPLGVILPVAVWGFSILVMSEFMREIPSEIDEAARLDGVGDIRMLFFIILPLSTPVLGVVTIFGFMMIWDQYLLPLIAANGPEDYTLTVALSVLRTDVEVGPGILLAGALLALLPSLLIYLLMQKSLIQGITAGATKG